MTSLDMKRELCEKMNISILGLTWSIGQSSQKFNEKLQCDVVLLGEKGLIMDKFGNWIWTDTLMSNEEKYR